MCPDCRTWKWKLWFNLCCVYWTEPWITSRPQQSGQRVRHIPTYLYHISSEQNCWFDRRARRRRADHSPVYVKATVWACSHTILSRSLLSNAVFSSSFLPPRFSHHTQTSLLTRAPAAAVGPSGPPLPLNSAASPLQMPPLNTPNAYYIKAEWLTGKSSPLPQNW